MTAVPFLARSGVAARRWYVAAPFVRTTAGEGGMVIRPVSTAHAKEIGTMRTACGQWAYSWSKMHDLPFPIPRGEAPGAEMCRDCLGVVLRAA